MQIVTNNKPRVLVALNEIPREVRGDFGYVNIEDWYTPRLVKYRGMWYDTYDTEPNRQAGRDIFPGWACFLSESFFSGVVFRFVGDDEVICGRYFS